LIKYGQDQPPKYDLSKIKIPMAIFSGDEDSAGSPSNIKWLLDESQSGLSSKLMLFHKQYHLQHDSFIWGSTKSMMYFNDVIDILNSRLDTTEINLV
jgi:lysosomal acid lipase/cholesteryl ester hydrolase